MSVIRTYSSKERAFLKESCLELLGIEKATTLSQCGDILKVSKFTLYNWRKNDAEWAEKLKLADEIIADRLEVKLDKMSQPVAIIARLNALRPEKYRSRYEHKIVDPELKKLFQELSNLGEKKADVKPSTA